MVDKVKKDNFYEKYWEDYKYKEKYAFYVAFEDRVPAINKVWSNFKKPNKVLDFGCGNGVLTYLLKCSGFGKNIVGVDISKTGIKHASKFFSNKDLSFKTMDEFITLKDKKFDLIVSSHVFEHIHAPEKTLDEIKNLSEWFLIEVPLEKAVWPNFLAMIKKTPRENNSPGHVNFWNKASFKSFIESRDFIIVKDFHYASAPFSKYNHWIKRFLQRVLLEILGINAYSFFMSTHFIVLARRQN